VAKRRADLVILMDILGNLLDGAKGPTRLAQACNLTFDTMTKFVGVLIDRGLVQVSTEGSHEVYSITQTGVDMHRQYRGFWEMLYPSDRPDTR
jgi:predicted transcriptional regulator